MAESPASLAKAASPPWAAFRALVGLELYRSTVALRRVVILGAGVSAFLTLVGWGTPGRYAFILTVIGMTILMSAVLSTLSDKATQGLEFLVSLPVERSVLAGARLAAGVVLSLAASPFLAAAVLLVSGSALPAVGLALRSVATGGVIFVTGALGVALCIGVGLRIRVRQFGALFLVGFVGVTALEHAVQAVLPHERPALLKLVAWPWLPQVAGASGVLLAAAVGRLAYWLARTGYERHRPERDEVQA
jgi:hypothetical protein